MLSLSIEPTNICNRECLHCVRNKEDELESLPLETIDKILSQARSLGMKRVHLTGGEIAVYPYLEGLLKMLVDYGFNFDMVTNSFRFKERLLPILLVPKMKRKLEAVCFSLDGSSAQTHDAIRGDGSFKEVMEAATLCRLKDIRITLKSVITNLNKDELTELALLGATLGAQTHGFLHLFLSVRLIKEGLIPSPMELNRIAEWIMGSLATSVKTKIHMEGWCSGDVAFSCGNIIRGTNVDYRGNLILCCNLSHVENSGSPSTFGDEFLADLNEVPLKEGLIRHWKAVATLMEAMLNDVDKRSMNNYGQCYWCFKHFGKLNWLKEFSDSPWAEGVRKEEALKDG